MKLVTVRTSQYWTEISKDKYEEGTILNITLGILNFSIKITKHQLLDFVSLLIYQAGERQYELYGMSSSLVVSRVKKNDVFLIDTEFLGIFDKEH